jgi:hypothetical protein
VELGSEGSMISHGRLLGVLSNHSKRVIAIAVNLQMNRAIRIQPRPSDLARACY